MKLAAEKLYTVHYQMADHGPGTDQVMVQVGPVTNFW